MRAAGRRTAPIDAIRANARRTNPVRFKFRVAVELLLRFARRDPQRAHRVGAPVLFQHVDNSGSAGGRLRACVIALQNKLQNMLVSWHTYRRSSFPQRRVCLRRTVLFCVGSGALSVYANRQ